MFLKTNLSNEICYHLSENKAAPKSQRKEEKEGARRKKGEEEKSNGCTLGFYNGYFGDSFWPKKKTVGRKKVHLAVRF